LLAGRWFGVVHLDGRLGGAMLAVFGLSALVALWLGGSMPPVRQEATQRH